MGYPLSGRISQISPGKSDSLPLMTTTSTVWGSGSIGLSLVAQGRPPQSSLICGFCPLAREFALGETFQLSKSGFLRIPPHGGHPCLRLYPSHYRADSGLSPVRNVRRRAHKQNVSDASCRQLTRFSILRSKYCACGINAVAHASLMRDLLRPIRSLSYTRRKNPCGFSRSLPFHHRDGPHR